MLRAALHKASGTAAAFDYVLIACAIGTWLFHPHLSTLTRGCDNDSRQVVDGLYIFLRVCVKTWFEGRRRKQTHFSPLPGDNRHPFLLIEQVRSSLWCCTPNPVGHVGRQSVPKRRRTIRSRCRPTVMRDFDKLRMVMMLLWLECTLCCNAVGTRYWYGASYSMCSVV